MSTKSTTIRISFSTKEKIESLDFVRKDTFDEILLKLMEFYEQNKRGFLFASHEKDNNSTTIRITQSTKEKIESLDFVRKDTFDEILLKLIEYYEKRVKK